MILRTTRWLAVLLLLSPLVALPALRGQESPAAIEADFEVLKKVIVMSIDDSIRKSSEMGRSVHPIFNKGLGPRTIEEHRALVDIMKREGVEVLQVRDLLQDAIENARRKGELGKWVEAAFPSQKEKLMGSLDRIDADAVLQRSEDSFYRKTEAMARPKAAKP